MSWLGRNHMPVEGRVRAATPRRARENAGPRKRYWLTLNPQTILLTGGSEGTGLCAARIFSAKGANVVIVSRNSAKLEEAVESIKAAAKFPETQRFHTIVADVADPSFAEGVVADATAWNHGQPPEIVWCLAGLSTPMLWTDSGAMKAARYNSKYLPT